MGCINSKLKPDDVVGRCKARKSFMKQAVLHRDEFASAHTAYLLALRNTGAALRQFAEAEGAVSGSGLDLFTEVAVPPPPPPLLQEESPTCKKLELAEHINGSGESRGGVDGQYCNKKYEASVGGNGGNKEHGLDDSEEAHSVWDSVHILEFPVHYQKLRRAFSTREGEPRALKLHETVEFRGDESGKKPSSLHRSESGFKLEDTQSEEASSVSNSGPGITEKPDFDEADEKDKEDLDGKLSRLKRLAMRKSLAKIAAELDEEFLKAAASGADLSRFLEAGAGHFGVDPKQSKFGGQQPARIFSTLVWNWSWSTPSTKEEPYANISCNPGSNVSHSLTLERLLAWEKKLFDEVKAMESLRADMDKKCSVLRRLEIRGEDMGAIEKVGDEIKRLHSLLMIAYQGVDSTMEAIEDLRDDELHPQLVALVEGLKDMWDTMQQRHAQQSQIIVHIKSLDAVMTQESTSDAHFQATIQLEKELIGWHQSFCKLLSSHRSYMDALYGWVKLSTIPIPTTREKIGDCGWEPKAFKLIEEWQRAMSCLPDRVAAEALKSFAEVVKVMARKQLEEMHQRKKVEKMERQWEKKVKVVEEEQEREGRNRTWMTQDDSDDCRIALSSSDVLPFGFMQRGEAVAAYRQKVEWEMHKHSKSVQDIRAFTMNNLQTGLPAVLEAMAGFSTLSSQAFQQLWSLTRFHPLAEDAS